jgi:hypothetical protein
LRFDVRTDFLSLYNIHVVGNSSDREYWVPAGDVEELNRNIEGTIQVIREFRRTG